MFRKLKERAAAGGTVAFSGLMVAKSWGVVTPFLLGPGSRQVAAHVDWEPPGSQHGLGSGVRPGQSLRAPCSEAAPTWLQGSVVAIRDFWVISSSHLWSKWSPRPWSCPLAGF